MTKQIPTQIANFQLEQHEGKLKTKTQLVLFVEFFLGSRWDSFSISYSMQNQKPIDEE